MSATITGIPGLTEMDYDELLTWINSTDPYQNLDAWLVEANKYDVSEMAAVEDYMTSTGINFTKNAAGNYSITGYDSIAQTAVNTGLPDSNLASTARGKFTTMINRGQTALGKLNMTTRPAGGGFAANAKYFVGSAASAVGAVSAGIALGKTIDSALYNLNPDFWDENGMSSINPETWNSITSGDDSWQAGLFNFIFGLDPDTGKAQAYMDANAFALMAMYMNQMGMFGNGEYQVTGAVDGVDVSSLVAYPFDFTYASVGYSQTDASSYNTFKWQTDDSVATALFNYTTSSSVGRNLILASTSPFNYGYRLITETDPPTTYPNPNQQGTLTSFNNKSFYMKALSNSYSTSYNEQHTCPANPLLSSPSGNDTTKIAYNMLYGGSGGSSLDGVGNQEGATLPDTSQWDTVPNTLTALQNQYPDLFNNALTWDNVQPDGSNPQLTYLPIPWPNISGYNDTQPTSSTATQTDTQISDLVKPLVETMMDLLRQPQTQPDTQTSTTPQNPVDTGTGDTSSPILPVGNASALWSVYNPTQGQVDSFGAWLWSSPFETNIGKLFQNPIDGVITLHKIFATPVTGAAANIVVGTLDSGVSSATVPSQYTTVDCGSISLNEDFANVFDYAPFTSVSLYLPFIGIVPLDVNDVMRSTISVTYGVDVYTGACLAMVEVTRDGNTVNMYQYSGVCSVEYPITNVQHSQVLSGVLTMAGGIAAIMSAGASVPASLAIAGGAASAAKSHVGRSGSFSGNSGAMGIKVPYLIIQRPQTKVADLFPQLAGYPTNVSGKLSDFSGQVIVKDVHIEGIPATDSELTQIEELLKSGILI